MTPTLNPKVCIMRATWLLNSTDAGTERCVYCGHPCDDARPAEVKKTWSDWPSLANPSGMYRCEGCERAMDERAVLPGRDKPQKVRTYSWLVTRDTMVPASKGEIPVIRQWCTHPPPPPYAICIATSGQKQLLYRTPACLDHAEAVATLEGEVVAYRPDELARLLVVTDRISAAAGKMVLAEPMGVMTASRILDYWTDGESIVDAWSPLQPTPLGRLAAFLALPKKDASEKHASDTIERIVPSKTRGAGRSGRGQAQSLWV